MESEITIKKDYILVEPQEIEFWLIMECFAKLFQLPEYPCKNTIWLFRDVHIKISWDRLQKIKDLIKDNLPAGARHNKKVALVVKTGLQTVLAEEYTKIAKDLPREFKIFSDLSTAEEWIVNN